MLLKPVITLLIVPVSPFKPLIIESDLLIESGLDY